MDMSPKLRLVVKLSQFLELSKLFPDSRIAVKWEVTI